MRPDRTRAPAPRGPPAGSNAEPSPFLDPQAAGCGPFLDPREIVICAVAIGPHRQVQRPIGLILVFEFRDQRLELLASIIGGGIGVLRGIALPDLQLQWPVVSRRIVT